MKVKNLVVVSAFFGQILNISIMGVESTDTHYAKKSVSANFTHHKELSTEDMRISDSDSKQQTASLRISDSESDGDIEPASNLHGLNQHTPALLLENRPNRNTEEQKTTICAMEHNRMGGNHNAFTKKHNTNPFYQEEHKKEASDVRISDTSPSNDGVDSYANSRHHNASSLGTVVTDGAEDHRRQSVAAQAMEINSNDSGYQEQSDIASHGSTGNQVMGKK